MSPVLAIAAPLIVLTLMAALSMAVWRMIVGPTIVDRIVALDMLTGVAVALAALTAAATGRREFLDIAFGLALIAFVGTCAFAGFLERKGRPGDGPVDRPLDDMEGTRR